MTRTSYYSQDRLSKIVGGAPTSPFAYKFLANLRYNDEFSCGGTILSSLFILTAAHCVKYKISSRLHVVAGDHNRLLPDLEEQVRNVSHIILHQDYNWDTDENDIAILSLSVPFAFNGAVGPVTLPKEKNVAFSSGTTIGWGKTSENASSPASDVPRQVILPIINATQCRALFAKVKNIKIIDSMICAGSEGKDSCKGDSGGPLMCEDNIQCGIVSHGIGCGRKGFPGVYTNVAHFLPWIAKTMESFGLRRRKCKMNRFYCTKEARCLPRQLLCDGKVDCEGPSDEIGCFTNFTTLLPGYFRCDNGISVKESWVCDGHDDCGDHSDEEKCEYSTCPSNGTAFRCKVNPRCIDRAWVCDDIIDCDDASDEAECYRLPAEVVPTIGTATDATLDCSSKGFFKCSTGLCIPERWVCDGDPDCRNGEDEVNCNSTTPARTPTTSSSTTAATATTPKPRSCREDKEFKCASGQCILKAFLCDNDQDCEDGSDEVDCSNVVIQPASPINASSSCGRFQWRCERGLGPNPCIYHRFRCDGDPDCLDGSDERGC